MTQLKNKLISAAFTTLAAVGLAIVPATNASAAPAKPSINQVPCGRSDFLSVWWHPEGGAPRSVETCFANVGSFFFPSGSWLDAFSTGNNSVEFLADGKWQPADPVGPNTFYTFPNHPHGVNLQGIMIMP